MRLFIYSMPLLALAMLLCNYSARYTRGDIERSVADPQAAAIARKIYKNNKTPQNLSPQIRMVASVFKD